jgi:hypothetical protein
MARLYGNGGQAVEAPPLVNVLRLSYTQSLDRISTFTAEFAATKDALTNVTVGRQIRFFVDGEGEVFRGFVEQVSTMQRGDQMVLTVAGGSVARSLAWKTTLLGRTFSAVTLSSAVSTLLSGTGWTSGSIASPTTTLSIRFDGRSIWDALQAIAELFGLSLRENSVAQTIDVNSFGGTPSVIAVGASEVPPSASVALITSVEQVVEGSDVVTRIVPLGQQTGVLGSSPFLTIEKSTRSSPYTRQSATGPDGKTYWYIADSAAESTYGVRERVVQFRDILPASTSAADVERAANALYDEAVSMLIKLKQPLETYRLTVTGLSQVSGWRVGDSIRVLYRGGVRKATGQDEVLMAIDRSDLYIVSARRDIVGDGDSWALDVSNVRRELPNDGNVTEKFIEQLQAVRSAPLPFVLFGDNAARISNDGLQLVSPAIAEVGPGTYLTRKVSWYSDEAFTNQIGEIAMSYLGTPNLLNAGYGGLIVNDPYGDGGLKLAVRDKATDKDMTVLRLQRQGLLPWPLIVEHRISTGSPLQTLLMLEPKTSTDWQLLVLKNGQLRPVGGLMAAKRIRRASTANVGGTYVSVTPWQTVTSYPDLGAPTAVTGASSNSSISITRPGSGGALYVLLVAAFSTVTTPSGWSLQWSTSGGGLWLYLFTRTTDPGTPISITAAGQALCARFDVPYNASLSFAANGVGTTSTQVDAPSVTLSNAKRAVHAVMHMGASTITGGWPSTGFTEHFNALTSSQSWRAALASAPVFESADPGSVTFNVSTNTAGFTVLLQAQRTGWPESLITGVAVSGTSGVVSIRVDGSLVSEIDVSATASAIVPLPVPVYVPAGGVVEVSRTGGTTTVILQYVDMVDLA